MLRLGNCTSKKFGTRDMLGAKDKCMGEALSLAGNKSPLPGSG